MRDLEADPSGLRHSIRRSGDAARAIPIRPKALAIAPKHKGAHDEYIDEA